MKIHIYTIHKDEKLESATQYYVKASRAFGAEIMLCNVFDKQVQDAHRRDSNLAKQSYSKAFAKYLDRSSILLDCGGVVCDTNKFSQIIESYLQRGNIKFFIAGAFGFEEKLLKQYYKVSLSPLTFSHEIAKLVLLEQVYRGLSIINNHPYHKN